MTKLDVTVDELKLAWRRLRVDLAERTFLDHPHLIEWLELELDSWLDSVGRKLAAGYAPSAAQPCPTPKPGFLIRPATILSIEDALVYTLLLCRMHERIYEALRASQGDPDVAYQLMRPDADRRWIFSGFRVWRQWRTRSRQKLDRGAEYVLVTDMTGYYENIDLSKLESDLRALGVNAAELQVLQTCLRRWAVPRGRGIPQGYSASDILAKLYMSPVDSSLRNEGFSALRYVDDIRIFVASKLEAQRGVLRLTQLLYARGLNMQSAKTEILSREEAVAEIDGIDDTIREMNRRIIEEIRARGDDRYVPPALIESFLRESDGPPPPVLERAFQERFTVSGGAPFSATLFHFLLTRLGAAKSRVAITYCLELLPERPEETAHILRYLRNFDLAEMNLKPIFSYLASPNAIYDYQIYQCMRFFYLASFSAVEVLHLARQFAYDQNRLAWLRSYCFAILGAHGDRSDLEAIETHYSGATSELEQADHVAAVEKLELSRRNSFYSRICGDGELVVRAIKLIKGGH